MVDEDAGARDVEVAELARTVRALSERVAELERGLTPSAQSAAALPAPPPLAEAVTSAVAEPAVDPAGGTTRGPRLSAVAQARRSAVRLPTVDRERLPVIVMGAAGGVALLMGTLYFAWYSIQQGWISPEVRLSITGVFGLGAMGLAWSLAPRGHRTVAASLGGAGLGAWFGAVLVARHSYEFISPAATFALLVCGASVGIWIATQRRLRFFATLAAIAALVTPLSIGYYEDRLHERMAYQLVVVVFLYAIEQRRRWIELGTLAVFGTWILLGSWASDFTGQLELTGVAGWAFVYLIVGHVQSWRMLRAGRISNMAATPRLWFNAYAAWFVAGEAVRGHDVAYTALAMAVLNGVAVWGLCGALEHRPTATDAERASMARPAQRFWEAACLAACSSVAWLQAFAFAPLRWETDAVIGWWVGMAALMTVLHLRRPSYAYALPFLLPLVAALGFSAESAGSGTNTAVVLGFVAAALPFVLALAPSRVAVERRGVSFDSYLALQLALGCLVWGVMSLAHSKQWDSGRGWFMVLGVAAAAVLSLRVIAQPSRARSAVVLLYLAALVLASILLSHTSDLFDALEGFGTERWWQIGSLVGLALIALNFGARLGAESRPDDAVRWPGRMQDLAGIVRPAALLVVAMLLVSGSVASITDDLGNARSINQAGWSVCWAVAGLTLLLRGLRSGRGVWRGAGMLALFATGTKLLAVDLVHVSMIWRVLSFVGLGACLLLGAYAYRRLSPKDAPLR